MGKQQERDDQRVLESLRYEDTLKVGIISRNCGISIEVAQQSIDRLVRQGYVKQAEFAERGEYMLTELARKVCFGGE